MTNETLTSEDLEKFLKSAFRLGQEYWQQADSDSWKEEKKSGETFAKFHKLLAECLGRFEEGV